MNASFLTGIAAALKGGLQGYQTAQTQQRQEALDELQRKREQDNTELRLAALANASKHNADTAAAQAAALEAKKEALTFQRKDQERKGFMSRFGYKGNDFGDLEAQMKGYADDYANAPDGPAPAVDQYGVIQGADEWNNVPQDKQTKGYYEARAEAGPLRDAARRQAEISARQRELEDKKLKVQETKANKTGPGAGAGKALPAAEVNNLSDIEGLVNRLKTAHGAVPNIENKVALGKIPNKIQDALKLFNAADPDVAALAQQVGYVQASYMKLISGAAINESEVSRLSRVVPTMDDSPEIIKRKIPEFARILSEARDRKARDFGGSGYNASAFSKPLDLGWIDGPSGPAGRLSAPPPPPFGEVK